MNVKLLRKVARVISEEPKRFNMSVFGEKYKPGTLVSDENVWVGNRNRRFPAPACGTTACIAGWAVLLGTPKRKLGFDPFVPRFTHRQKDAFDDLMFMAEERATDLLELDYEQAGRLFFAEDWPQPFRDQYRKSRTAAERADVGKRYIAHFIKTDGAEGKGDVVRKM